MYIYNYPSVLWALLRVYFAGICALLVFVFGACGDSHSNAVRVDIVLKDIPGEAAYFHIAPALDQKPAQVEALPRNPSGPTRLALLLADAPQGGALSVSVEALDREQCSVARGFGKILAVSGRYNEVAVQLNSLGSRRCQCNIENFCDESLSNHSVQADSESLYTISGKSDNDLWGIGESGSPVHWDGKTWSTSVFDFSEQVYRIWSNGPIDAWAKTRNLLYHFDGETWSSAALGGFKIEYGALWGAAMDDMWLAGSTILHWDGSQWSEKINGLTGSPSIFQMHGSAPNNIWALGSTKLVIYWDGTKWNTVPFTDPNGAGSSLVSVFALAANDVWIVGNSSSSTSGKSFVLHWNGSALAEVANPLPNARWSSVWASGATDVWLTGENDTGRLVMRWDGKDWSQVMLPQGADVRSVWGLSAQKVWLLGSAPYYGDGVSWTATPFRAGSLILSLSGSDPQNLWLTSRTVPMQWNGTDFSSRYTVSYPAPGNYSDYRALWSGGPNDVWAIGRRSDSYAAATASAAIFRWDGHSQWLVAVPEKVTEGPLVNLFLMSISGRTPYDVWVVGEKAQTLHWDGIRFTNIPTNIGLRVTLRGVSVGDERDAWAVGDQGVILHWNGSAWSLFASGTTEQLNAVFGATAQDGWAVGNHGTVLHFDGVRWTKLDVGVSVDLHALSGRSGQDIWMAGDLGTLLHYDGMSWRQVASGTQARLTTLWATVPHEVWAGGDHGILLRRRPSPSR